MMNNVFFSVIGICVITLEIACLAFLYALFYRMSRLTQSIESMQLAAKNLPTANRTDESVITNRQEIIAAVSAAIAADMGTDVSGIRILSFKRI